MRDVQCFREHGELGSISFPRQLDQTVHFLERGVEVVLDGRALHDRGFDGVWRRHGGLRDGDTRWVTR